MLPSDIRALSLVELAAAYRAGRVTAEAATQAYLDVIEVGNVYRLVTAERALEQARRADDAFAAGQDHGMMQGIPVALKDLMDTTGDVTSAGSRVLAEDEPAAADCPAAAHLDAAGAVFLGKTNMTELAFSGLGMNPHYGTPSCVFVEGHLPGGSSSGSGVAVGRQWACAAVGSDTGGSIRIPAAFNGLVGLKPTDGAISTEGVVPLSITLDTLGPMTRTVKDAYYLWFALRGVPKPPPFPEASLEGKRFLAPQSILQMNLAPAVKTAFLAMCDRLTAAGAQVDYEDMPQLAEVFDLYYRYGSFAGTEALALYEDLLITQGERLDPRVSMRIAHNTIRPATDYVRLHLERRRVIREVLTDYAFDAILGPTVAVLPPRIDDMVTDEVYLRTNALCLRNTMPFNFLGVPAITLPCATTTEGFSVGFMLATRPNEDVLALSLAQAMESMVMHAR